MPHASQAKALSVCHTPVPLTFGPLRVLFPLPETPFSHPSLAVTWLTPPDSARLNS